ncbi:MAG TPA: hypothetical protein VIM27_05115, partial [Gaiellales bacterium]
MAQARREDGDRRLGVVAGTVEPAVDEPLYALPQRVERRRGRQRRGGHANLGGERKHGGGQDDDSHEDADKQCRQDGVGQRPADQPVDLVQPVSGDAYSDTDRQRGEPDR